MRDELFFMSRASHSDFEIAPSLRSLRLSPMLNSDVTHKKTQNENSSMIYFENTFFPSDDDYNGEDDDDEEDDQPEPISYESKLNLMKFQQFLQEEEKNLHQHDPPTLIAQQNQSIVTNGKPTHHNHDNGDSEMSVSEEVPNLQSNFLQVITSALSAKNSDLRDGLLSKDPHVMMALMAALAGNPYFK